MLMAKNYRFISFLLCFFSFISYPAKCSLESLLLDDTWPMGKQRPHVVFDIDDSLCIKLRNGLDKRLIVRQRSPETILIPFHYGANSLFTHAFFPGIGELFLSLLSWGWNIDFFSSGLKERNEFVIPVFLKVAFAPYFEDPGHLVEHLMKSRLRIFSKQDMISDKNAYKYSEYERGGHNKKDLRTLKVPLDHIILVEDDVTYAVGGEQFPPLCVNWGASSCFSDFILGKVEYEPEKKGPYDARENAGFLLGVLS
jgi:hypothetical protein